MQIHNFLRKGAVAVVIAFLLITTALLSSPSQAAPAVPTLGHSEGSSRTAPPPPRAINRPTSGSLPNAPLTSSLQMLIPNYMNNTIQGYDADTGAHVSIWASGNGLYGPLDAIYGPDGNIYASCHNGGDVLRYTNGGIFLGAFVRPGDGNLNGPFGMAFGPDGNFYVTSQNSNQVMRFNGQTGAFIDVFVTAGSGGLNYPTDLHFGPDNNLYVTSQDSNQVLQWSDRAVH